ELSIAENIFLDKLPRSAGLVRYTHLYEQTGNLLKQFGMGGIDPATPVKRLGVGSRQLVEIARGLRQDCRVLILDEPTASLTDQEAKVLFEHIRRLRNKGVAIVYISHRMEEINRLADRITILRDGQRVGEYAAGELTPGQMIRNMVGRELTTMAVSSTAASDMVLRVVDLNRPPRVRNVSFDLHRGEILGFAGLNGAGRTEAMRCIFGADKPHSGSIYLYGDNNPTPISSPALAVRHGIAWLSEDRKDEGLILTQAVCRNITLTRMSGVSRWGWIQTSRERQVGESSCQILDIRCQNVEQAASSLSGGNQQKIILAKWLWRDCNILICDEPTRGIDVGAKFEIYRLLRQLAAKGKAIIMISSELSELLALCDRIAVMSVGKLTAVFDRQEFDQDAIMTAAFAEHLKSSPQTITA
ncbi:MAG: sugar ABC transporter ATP-binding protein, partial [Sedimentisphaerales bacterium]|nr:sugar ABC transporter ATP-binding protein [Sedimentisphaerales bacterium]